MNNGRQSAGDNTPDVEAADLEMDDEYIDEAALQVLPALGPDTAEWQVIPLGAYSVCRNFRVARHANSVLQNILRFIFWNNFNAPL